MRAIISLIIPVAIFVIVIVLILIINNFMQNSADISESQLVLDQLKLCNAKILQTAERGVTNRCEFYVKRGGLSVGGDSVSYRLISNAILCSPTDWVNISQNLWQNCEIIYNFRIYQLKWNSPEILFQITGRNIFGKISGIEVKKISDVKIIRDGKEISGTLLDIKGY